MTTDSRMHAPATERNREAILTVLKQVLPESAAAPVLEIGSGSGEHVVHFAQHLPTLQWQPSEATPDPLASIKAWIDHQGVSNVAPPVVLDVNASPWPIAQACAVLAINVIHYSPWETTTALLDGAAGLLPEGGVLYLYGPYMRDGAHTAPSNLAFDGWLKARNPAFGVRDLDTVVSLAQARGLALDRVVDMPANNLSVVFRRAAIRSPAPD